MHALAFNQQTGKKDAIAKDCLSVLKNSQIQNVIFRVGMNYTGEQIVYQTVLHLCTSSCQPDTEDFRKKKIYKQKSALSIVTANIASSSNLTLYTYLYTLAQKYMSNIDRNARDTLGRPRDFFF